MQVPFLFQAFYRQAVLLIVVGAGRQVGNARTNCCEQWFLFVSLYSRGEIHAY